MRAQKIGFKEYSRVKDIKDIYNGLRIFLFD